VTPVEGTPPAHPVTPPTGCSRNQVPSTALFQGRREVVIVHRGVEYRLRITRADKLILTK
jgi:hemin uptake protein HemP